MKRAIFYSLMLALCTTMTFFMTVVTGFMWGDYPWPIQGVLLGVLTFCWIMQIRTWVEVCKYWWGVLTDE